MSAGAGRVISLIYVLDTYLTDARDREVHNMTMLELACSRAIMFFGNRDIEAHPLETMDLRNFRKFLRESFHQGPSSANNAVRILLAALRYGDSLGLVSKVPRQPRRLPEPAPRQGFLEWEDFVAIAKELPPHARAVWEFAYYSGWRRNEILGLTWSEVDLADGWIRLNPKRSKNGHGRAIPLVADLRRIIERRLRSRVLGVPWVFCSKYAKHMYPQVWQRLFESARARAGRPNVILHDCRRTAARNLIRAGVPERIAMQITGHRTRSMFDRYNIVREDELAEALGKMSRYLEKKAAEASERGGLVPFEKKKA